jgi:signal peptide peptidase SppA
MFLDKEFWAGTEESLAAALRGEAAMEDPKAALPGSAEDALPYTLSGNVAIIPIKGPLVNSSSPFLEFFGMTGYPKIRESLIAAVKDPKVGEILLDINSGGGSVSGASDTADLIARINEHGKPVTTFADGMMASAAYWLGSSAGKVISSNTAIVGSIGVITTHFDRSAQLEQDGIKATVIRAGEFKALASPLEPLSKAARAQIQEQLDEIYAVFMGQVAEARGVSYEAGDKSFGQGREFIGDAAVKSGLVDSVGSFDAVLSDLHKKAVDKRNPAYDNGINKNRSAQLKPKATLTDRDLAILAQGGSLVAEAAPEAPIAAVTPEAPETESKDKPAAEATPAPAADATPAPADGVVTYLQGQVAAKDAQILELSLALQAEKDRAGAMEASHVALVAIAAKSVSNMQIALDRKAGDVSKLGATELLARHQELTAAFEAQFPAGGVAAVSAGQSAKKEAQPDGLAASRLQAVRIQNKK